MGIKGEGRENGLARVNQKKVMSLLGDPCLTREAGLELLHVISDLPCMLGWLACHTNEQTPV